MSWAARCFAMLLWRNGTWVFGARCQLVEVRPFRWLPLALFCPWLWRIWIPLSGVLFRTPTWCLRGCRACRVQVGVLSFNISRLTYLLTSYNGKSEACNDTHVVVATGTWGLQPLGINVQPLSPAKLLVTISPPNPAAQAKTYQLDYSTNSTFPPNQTTTLTILAGQNVIGYGAAQQVAIESRIVSRAEGGGGLGWGPHDASFGVCCQIDNLTPETVTYYFRARVAADSSNFGPPFNYPSGVVLHRPLISDVYSNSNGSANGSSQSTMATNGGQLFTISGIWLGTPKSVFKVRQCQKRV